jgi:hypothetical protein
VIDTTTMKYTLTCLIGLVLVCWSGMRPVFAQDASPSFPLQLRADMSIRTRTPTGSGERIGIVQLGGATAEGCRAWCAALGAMPLAEEVFAQEPAAFASLRATGFWTMDAHGNIRHSRHEAANLSAGLPEPQVQCLCASPAFTDPDRDGSPQ